MALRRNQPYLPLYVNDFMIDEKLAECSAAATGVYIRIMCLMHKSEEYGKVLLKQTDKQTENVCLNFACKLSRNFPYTSEVINGALSELLLNKVLCIEGDYLVQRRMVKDGILSSKRSEIGAKGGLKTQSKGKTFAKAKHQANTDIDIDNDIGIISSISKYVFIENFPEIFKPSEMFANMRAYFGFTPEQMNEWLYEFVKFRKASSNPNDEIGNLVDHMRNWIAKRLEKQIIPEKNGRRESMSESKNSVVSGFAAADEEFKRERK